LIVLTPRLILALPLLLWPAAARAQDVPTGPAKGEKVPPLKVFDATGAHKDKEVDYAAERKDKPTVYVLIQADKWTRPVHSFLHTLDKDLAKDHPDAYLVAVWLTDKVDMTKEYLPKIAQYYSEKAALTCFPGEKAGPKDWNVNADADVTVVVANKGKVAETFGYKSINATDVPKVLEAVKKAQEGK
jgi:hypothetical protein